MSDFSGRLLLDTNVFIIGFLEPDGAEAKLLQTLEARADVTLIFSNDLDSQIRRVGRRGGLQQIEKWNGWRRWINNPLLSPIRCCGFGRVAWLEPDPNPSLSRPLARSVSWGGAAVGGLQQD